MTGFFASLPKAELHLHLEGSVDSTVLRELEPAPDPAEVARRLRIASFQDFIETYKWVVGFLRTPDDYALVTRRLLERLERDNVRYAEITLSAGVILWKGLPFEPIYTAVTREAARSAVDVWWVLDAIRHFGPEPARQVAGWAAERAQDRVVAFGLGGDETRGPASSFHDVFDFARQHGLKLVPHAGEISSAQSVWEAVEAGADRIGHGIRAIDDPQLVACLRERAIPLEICVTSNLVTGAVDAVANHPVRRLYQAGVPIILNTDDPGLFGTTLSAEYQLAEDHCGFTRDELVELAAASFLHGFRSTNLGPAGPALDRTSMRLPPRSSRPSRR
jgi:adenosine deaminase/aminodeoxyfutalosine deaminase